MAISGSSPLEARGGHGGRGELDADAAPGRVGQVAGPGIVGVAGQRDQVLALVARQAQHGLARGRIAIPGVEVVGRLGLGDQGLLAVAARHLRGRLRQQVGAERLGRDGARHAQRHRPCASSAPAGRAPARCAAEAAMRPASQSTCAAPSSWRVGDAASPARYSSSVELLVAADQPRVEHVQRRQGAEVEGAIDVQRVGGVGQPRGQPFVIGLHGGGAARGESAFGGLVVVAGAAGPGVVGQVVIVPDRDHRQAGMHRPQVRVGAVLRVALPVVLQREDFVGRATTRDRARWPAARHSPAGRTRRCSRPGAAPASMSVRCGDLGIDVEIAGREVGARHHRQPGLRHAAHRQGLGAPGGRAVAAEREAIEVDAAPAAAPRHRP